MMIPKNQFEFLLKVHFESRLNPEYLNQEFDATELVILEHSAITIFHCFQEFSHCHHY